MGLPANSLSRPTTFHSKLKIHLLHVRNIAINLITNCAIWRHSVQGLVDSIGNALFRCRRHAALSPADTVLINIYHNQANSH